MKIRKKEIKNETILKGHLKSSHNFFKFIIKSALSKKFEFENSNGPLKNLTPRVMDS